MESGARTEGFLKSFFGQLFSFALLLWPWCPYLPGNAGAWPGSCRENISYLSRTHTIFFSLIPASTKCSGPERTIPGCCFALENHSQSWLVPPHSKWQHIVLPPPSVPPSPRHYCLTPPQATTRITEKSLCGTLLLSRELTVCNIHFDTHRN